MAGPGSVGLVAVTLATLAILSTAGGTRSYSTLRLSSGQQQQQPLRPSNEGAAAGVNATACGRDSDEICSLPGLAGNPHVRMRSGYVTVSEASDRRLWYLVADREGATSGRAHASTGLDLGGEQEREGEGGQELGPEAASPVLLWLTGGPGCSSLDAFIYEHGPFRFAYAGGKAEEGVEGGNAQQGGGERAGERPRDVVLTPNPYSWTKLATVIYVDSPAGAGMSYSGRTEDYHTDDAYTIADLVAFLEGLTERYPELAAAPFFIAGESYGGVFVPLLAAELVRVNKERKQDGRAPLVQLEGYSVGNPVTDDPIDGDAQLLFAEAMGYVDPPSWRRAREACGGAFWNATPGTDCWDAQAAVKKQLWDLNWYDVLDPCTKDNYGSSSNYDASSGGRGIGSSGAARVQHRRRLAGAPADEAGLARRFYWPFTARMAAPPPAAAEEGEGGEQMGSNDSEPEEGLEAGRRGGRRLWGPWLRHVAPCMDRRLALDWLNRADVRSALHAAPPSRLDWQPCSDVLHYRLVTSDIVPVHEKLVREGVRALVYSGDHDMVVPHTGTRAWLYDKARLGRVDGPLRPWFMGGQVAGFWARFGAGSGLTFATVKGAGHMVPQSRPAEALHLLRAFLRDEGL